VVPNVWLIFGHVMLHVLGGNFTVKFVYRPSFYYLLRMHPIKRRDIS